MKKRFFVSAVVAVTIAVCAFNTMHAQDGPAGPPIPPLSFHVVDNFFHYPAYSVIGRLSGVAVAPNGNVVALNRGYHPVLEFKSDGSFVRTWGEGSRMFEGAHSLRFVTRRDDAGPAILDRPLGGDRFSEIMKQGAQDDVQRLLAGQAPGLAADDGRGLVDHHQRVQPHIAFGMPFRVLRRVGQSRQLGK